MMAETPREGEEEGKVLMTQGERGGIKESPKQIGAQTVELDQLDG